VNFRHMKESNSLHLEEQIMGSDGCSKGTSMDRGGEDLFGGFSSVTLHYDGDS
jgi:protein-serine/threonine kinase